MRQIETMATAIGYAIFGGSADFSIFQFEESTAVSSELQELIDSGKWNEAENRLFELKEQGDPEAPALALWFYNYLRSLPEADLIRNDFSYEEIYQGLRDFFGEIPEAFSPLDLTESTSPDHRISPHNEVDSPE